MMDLISRQAAIDAVGSMLRRKFGIGGDLAEITLAGLPSAQADSKELSGTHKALDTVSRQAVIEAINKIFPADPMRDDYTQGITCGAALANIYVAQLPSAHPEKRTEERTETHACDLIRRRAVEHLDWFTKLYCRDKSITDDLAFRCKQCEFAMPDGICLVKTVARKLCPDYKDFGAMGDL